MYINLNLVREYHVQIKSRTYAPEETRAFKDRFGEDDDQFLNWLDCAPSVIENTTTGTLVRADNGNYYLITIALKGDNEKDWVPFARCEDLGAAPKFEKVADGWCRTTLPEQHYTAKNGVEYVKERIALIKKPN